VFVRNGTLLAQRFDLDRLKLVGDAVPLAERVRSDPLMGRSVFSVSAGSTLACEIGGTESGSRMVWIDRTTSPDAQTLIYTNDSSGYHLWLLLLGNLRSRSFIAAPGNQTFARFSPNGSCLAYDSHEAGRPEVYVTQFPSGRGKWQVSQQGGIMPTWRRDGRARSSI